MKRATLKDKDYLHRREYLRDFAKNEEITDFIDTISNTCINFRSPELDINSKDLNHFCYLDKTYNTGDYVKEVFENIYNMFTFTKKENVLGYIKKFLIDGFLAFEIIYDKYNTKIIGFKELDPASLRPNVEQTEKGFKKVWYQYENSSELKRELDDSQVIYISYLDKFNRLYLENLVRPFNLLRIIENCQLVWNIMNSRSVKRFEIPIGNKSTQQAKEDIAEDIKTLYKEDIELTEDGELFINGVKTFSIYKNYFCPVKNEQTVEVSNLSHYADFNHIDDAKYFLEKLRYASKIPFTDDDREDNRYRYFIKKIQDIFKEVLLKPIDLQLKLDKYVHYKDMNDININYF